MMKTPNGKETIDSGLVRDSGPEIIPAQSGPGSNSKRPVRWQWYHYYFVLALLDVLVIVAGVMVSHSTTTSFEIALQKLATTHTRQRWIANLRLRVINLNAPGNDVFESRKLEEERLAFHKQRDELLEILHNSSNHDFDLAEFRMHLDQMIEEEEEVFLLMEAAADAPEFLEQASRTMAAMDRHQTAAITALTEIEQGFLMRVESLLREHGSRLQLYATLEISFVAIIGLILLGMFWYGRKLHELHEEMQRQNQRVQNERLARLAAVGEVCAAVAHGIRNPLAAISSSAQLGIASAEIGTSTRSRMEDILAECARLNNRVTQLLTFASSKSRDGQVFSLRQAIEQAVTELAPRVAEKSLTIEQRFDADPWVEGDRESMVQSTIELLSNALDYSPLGGRITLSCADCKDRPGFVELIVRDEGPGIPTSVGNKVFDLFFTTRPGGTGVGLASVKHAVHYLGGDVAIGVEETLGTSIRIRLPMSSSPIKSPPSSSRQGLS